MGQYFLVKKRIGKKDYYYYQRVWKEGKRTRTHSIYVGPADRVGQTIYTMLDYGPGKPTSSLEKYLAGKSPEERGKFESVLAHNARYAQGVTSRAAFIEKTVEENRAFLGSTDEEKQYYDHLMTEAIHGAMNAASPPLLVRIVPPSQATEKIMVNKERAANIAALNDAFIQQSFRRISSLVAPTRLGFRLEIYSQSQVTKPSFADSVTKEFFYLVV